MQCRDARRFVSFLSSPSFLLYNPLRFCALVAAMEVERDSEEGAFVTEDVSAIIKEVRLPGRPQAHASALKASLDLWSRRSRPC